MANGTFRFGKCEKCDICKMRAAARGTAQNAAERVSRRDHIPDTVYRRDRRPDLATYAATAKMTGRGGHTAPTHGSHCPELRSLGLHKRRTHKHCHLFGNNSHHAVYLGPRHLSGNQAMNQAKPSCASVSVVQKGTHSWQARAGCPRHATGSVVKAATIACRR